MSTKSSDQDVYTAVTVLDSPGIRPWSYPDFVAVATVSVSIECYQRNERTLRPVIEVEWQLMYFQPVSIGFERD
jgi:hypothetical protein